MPLTIKSNNLDLLADIDYLSDKADAEGYGRSFLDSAIKALCDERGYWKYDSENDNVEISYNVYQKGEDRNVKGIIVKVNGKVILNSCI